MICCKEPKIGERLKVLVLSHQEIVRLCFVTDECKAYRGSSSRLMEEQHIQLSRYRSVYRRRLQTMQPLACRPPSSITHNVFSSFWIFLKAGPPERATQVIRIIEREKDGKERMEPGMDHLHKRFAFTKTGGLSTDALRQKQWLMELVMPEKSRTRIKAEKIRGGSDKLNQQNVLLKKIQLVPAPLRRRRSRGSRW